MLRDNVFEGRRCPLAQHGYSCDHRRERPQIVRGLLSAREALPVAVEVSNGNTADPATLTSQVEKSRIASASAASCWWATAA